MLYTCCLMAILLLLIIIVHYISYYHKTCGKNKKQTKTLTIISVTWLQMLGAVLRSVSRVHFQHVLLHIHGVCLCMCVCVISLHFCSCHFQKVQLLLFRTTRVYMNSISMDNNKVTSHQYTDLSVVLFQSISSQTCGGK